MLSRLVEFLRGKRGEIVTDVTVKAVGLLGYTRPRDIEVVDFDALLKAIDEFAREFDDDDGK